MPTLSIDLKQSLQFTCQRHVISLFKEFLELMESTTMDHDEALSKLAAALPIEYHKYIDLADYLTDDKCDRIRKTILRKGNDCSRAIFEEIDKFAISPR